MFILLKNIVLSAFALSNKEFIKNHDSENHSYTVEENRFINNIYINEFNPIDHNIYQSNNKNAFYNLFSVGIAVLVGNANVGIGSSITLNSRLVNSLSEYYICRFIFT